MKEIKKVGVWSLARISGVIGVVAGLIAGIIIAIMTTVLSSIATATGTQATGIGAFGISAIIIMPITYGIAGLIAGAIYAFVYNVIAKQVGGIEIKLA